MYHLGQKFLHPQNLFPPCQHLPPLVFRVQSITWWAVHADGGGWSVQPHLVVRVQQSQRTAAGCTSLSSTSCHLRKFPANRAVSQSCKAAAPKAALVPPRQNLARRAAPADFAHKLLLLCWNLLEKAKKESEIYLRGGQSQGFGIIPRFVLCLATMSPLSRRPTLPIKKCTIYMNW